MFRRASPLASGRFADRIKSIRETPASLEHIDVRHRKPRAPRQALYRPAVLMLERGERLDVVIRDLSVTGMRIEYFRRTPISDLVLVDEFSLPLRQWGRIAWRRDGTSGLYFVER